MRMSNRLAAVAVAATISIAPIAGVAQSASAAPAKATKSHTKVVKQTPAQKKAAAQAKAAAAKAKKIAAAKKHIADATAQETKARKNLERLVWGWTGARGTDPEIAGEQEYARSVYEVLRIEKMMETATPKERALMNKKRQGHYKFMRDYRSLKRNLHWATERVQKANLELQRLV